MNYQTYLFFEGRTEYIQGYDTPQHTYPLGSLMFGVLDLDAAPYLERGRTLLEKFRGVNFPENQTMQQSLATPDTCVYYQVASFYHDFATAVRQASPALFDLVEGYTLATFRRNERELKATQHSLWQFIQTEQNDSSYTFDESSLVYAIKDGRYTDLIRYCDKNRTEKVKVTEEIAECYAVADYYQATLLYYTYLERGEVQRQSEAQEVRKDAASRMGALSDYAGEIDTLFENYMAEH